MMPTFFASLLSICWIWSPQCKFLYRHQGILFDFCIQYYAPCFIYFHQILKMRGPVHTYPEICESANFFLRIRLASTRIQRIFRPYPEIFENALQSGNFFIRYEFVYVWTVVTANLRIRLRHFLESSLHVEHYKQTWRTARLYLLC